ncbi:hypothetical protein SAMN02745163_01212 [Clostridium cavendishii DSM 21758]|uniref:Uncharacterized protein n=1 Tax=Clostridium cavendishii DSM 21758 TaxID=1121302 RepID=A0A1M6G843_9CLOT|nr:hypothetical protein [Clostridium cavendishii]SHJ06106.1 hypothetical protein SAMN02745163_01212 [Clostridium cavendishii DSM 21758]
MNKYMDINLKKEYLKAYNDVSGALKRSIADKKFLNEVLDDLIEMLYTSQEDGRVIEEVLPKGAKGFIDDIEKTYYKEIPKKDVYLGLLGRSFIYMAIFCLIFYVTHSESMIVLVGIPTGLIYAILMHFIFGNFKNSKLRILVDFMVYVIILGIGSEVFNDVAKERLSDGIILLVIVGFGTIGYIISSKRTILSRTFIRR